MATKNITLKYESTLHALESLQLACEDLEKIVYEHSFNKKETQESQRIIRTYRNSLVKIFEITFDVFWKYMKTYLWEIHGIEQNSPKSVFKEAFKIKILAKNDVKKFLEMSDHRNQLVHTYNENIAIKISYVIPDYYKLMNKVIIQVKPTAEEMEKNEVL